MMTKPIIRGVRFIVAACLKHPGKRLRSITFALFFLVPASAFTQQVRQTGVVEYEVPVNSWDQKATGSWDGGQYWFFSNIESSARITFFEMLFEKVLNGEIPVRDQHEREVSPDNKRDLDNLFILGPDTLSETNPYPPYHDDDTVIMLRFRPWQVTHVRFREEWGYDTATLKFSKNVIAYAPIMNLLPFTVNDTLVKDGRRPLFWVSCNQTLLQPEFLTQRICYKVGEGPDILRPARVDSVFSNAFMDAFFRKTASGEIRGYTHSGNVIADAPLTAHEAMLSQYIISEEEYIRPDPPYDMYDSIIMQPLPTIETFQFMEEWSFDTVSFSISKKVTGICPLTRDRDPETGELTQWRPVFWIYFSDIWSPFRGKYRPGRD